MLATIIERAAKLKAKRPAATKDTKRHEDRTATHDATTQSTQRSQQEEE